MSIERKLNGFSGTRLWMLKTWELGTERLGCQLRLRHMFVFSRQRLDPSKFTGSCEGRRRNGRECSDALLSVVNAVSLLH